MLTKYPFFVSRQISADGEHSKHDFAVDGHLTRGRPKRHSAELQLRGGQPFLTRELATATLSIRATVGQAETWSQGYRSAVQTQLADGSSGLDRPNTLSDMLMLP